jgi:zinc protease
MLDVQVDFAAGSMFDPAGKSGLAALTRATLDNGAGKLDETAIAEQLADLGANLGGGPTPTAPASRCARCHPGQARSGARHPEDRALFDAAIFEREKARTIAGLKEAMTRPDSIAGKAFWAALPDHPYGRQATPETVAALTRDDLAAFHARYYTAANASITLVGDLSRQEAERIADQLPPACPRAPAALPAHRPASRRPDQLAHPASQAHIYIGLPAIERGTPISFRCSSATTPWAVAACRA